MPTIKFSATIRERYFGNDVKYVLHAASVTIDAATTVRNVEFVARPALSDITRFTLQQVDSSAWPSGKPVWVGSMTLLRSQVLLLEQHQANEGTSVVIELNVADILPDEAGNTDYVTGNQVTIVVEPQIAVEMSSAS
jgi:hypothetical protein